MPYVKGKTSYKGNIALQKAFKKYPLHWYIFRQIKKRLTFKLIATKIYAKATLIYAYSSAKSLYNSHKMVWKFDSSNSISLQNLASDFLQALWIRSACLLSLS